MSFTPMPFYDMPIGGDGKLKPSWIQYLMQVISGDRGKNWTPTFTNLGATGTPVITGRFYNIGQLCFFSITITPQTDTTSVAGTTYCDLPLVMQDNGFNIAVSNGTGSNAGMCDAVSQRIYTSGWVAIAAPVTVLGFVLAS